VLVPNPFDALDGEGISFVRFESFIIQPSGDLRVV
jgi:hypothetical protein